jgi:hypothetical protein
MAKRKHAAALFEVMHAEDRFPRQKAGWKLRAPNWFSGRDSADAGAAPQPVKAPIEPAAPRGPSLLARLFDRIPSIPRIGMQVDPERQVVSFQTSYSGAIVSAFTVMIAVALAYVVGRHSGHVPLPALAEQSTEQVRSGPVQADVLDIHEDDAQVAMASQSVPAAPAARKPAAAGVRPSALNEPKPPGTLVATDAAEAANPKRTVNLNYVIVQTYPPKEQKMAEEAARILNANGLHCTIETKLVYSPDWHAVVGTIGFSRVKNSPEYDAYVAKIEQIGATFGDKSKFTKFAPKPFAWREIKADEVKKDPPKR